MGGTHGGLSHFLCRKRAPVPHVRLHMLQAPQGLQSPSTCSGMGVLLTHSPARHHCNEAGPPRDGVPHPTPCRVPAACVGVRVLANLCDLPHSARPDAHAPRGWARTLDGPVGVRHAGVLSARQRGESAWLRERPGLLQTGLPEGESDQLGGFDRQGWVCCLERTSRPHVGDAGFP